MKLNCQAIERSLSIMTTIYKMLQDQFNQHKLQLSINGPTNLASNMNEPKTIFMRYSMEKMFNITETVGGCRIIAFSAKYAALLVSQPSNNAIFPGFGVKKVSWTIIGILIKLFIRFYLFIDKLFRSKIISICSNT